MTIPTRPVRLLWHADSYDRSVASIRLRLLQPASFLQGRGFDIVRPDGSMTASPVDGVIFSKSVRQDALTLALATKAAGGRVIYDLCDNLFEAKESTGKAEKLRVARGIMEIADRVIFSTAQLAAQVEAAVPAISGHVSIIPDMLDDMADAPDDSSLGERLSLALHERFLARHKGALHCVWFGKSHGKKAGLLHLTKIQTELERFSCGRPVTLTVIGDRRRVYWREARHWKVPHHFLRWSFGTFPIALRRHDVALIPLEQNGYTKGKTINRPATAILAGLGVIANGIDSYEELRPYIVFDDWCGGLEKYSAVPAPGDPLLRAARDHLDARFGCAIVGSQWEKTLRGIFP